MENFEDYSLTIKPLTSKVIKGKLFCFENCDNNNLISEASFTRMYAVIKSKTFAILTAHRIQFTKKENIDRNRTLRSILNSRKIGVHQLVGHWLEAPDGIDYTDAKPSELTDTIERSYLVVKPDNMSNKEFTDLIVNCLTIDGKTQDSALIHYIPDETNKANQDDKFYTINTKYELQYVGEKMTLGKIAQAYSQHVKKINIPFIFEGLEIPGSNSGRMMFSRNNLIYNY